MSTTHTTTPEALTTAQHAYLGQFHEDPGYLDHARVGPVSTTVAETGARVYSALTTAGDGTVDTLMVAENEALTAAAVLVGLRRDQVVFTPSTSAGLFQAAFALPRRSPSSRLPRVVISGGEFPANLYPWWRAAQAGLITIDELEPSPTTADSVRPAVCADTAAIVVSAVDYTTGYRADLAALREVAGDALLIVDAIQGLGAVDQDWTAADVIVAGGQKWLRSGWSTGVIGCSDRALDRLEPLLAGWTAVEDPTAYDHVEHPLAPGAARLSETNTSPIAQAAFAAGLNLLNSVGVHWVQTRITSHVDAFIDVLDAGGAVLTSPRPAEQRAGVVSFSVPGVSGHDLHTALTREGVTCTRHGDRIRLAVHATTTAEAATRVQAVLPR